jgi:hypothetical protein
MLVYIIMLIKILIVFFTCLLGYQLFLAFTNRSNLVEGLENAGTTNGEYKPYDKNDPNNTLILAQQNAGNIEVLNGRVTKLDGLNDKVNTLQQIVDGIQPQIDALVQQQANYATDLAGDTPVEITGLNEEPDQEEEQI